MASYTYPHPVLDDRKYLVALLGAFWGGTFDQEQLIDSIAFSKAQQEQQTAQIMSELIACGSRQQVPLASIRRWHQLVLRESDMNSANVLAARYGDAGLLYGATSLNYGEAAPAELTDVVFSFPLDSTIESIPMLCSRIEDPASTWLNGADFTIDKVRGIISFRENPFANANLAVRSVTTGGVTTDREVSLWAFRAELYSNYIHEHVAYPLGIELDAGQNYKDMVNALWDGIIRGTAVQDVQASVAAVLDVPLAREDGEIVAVVDTLDPGYLVIITDKHVYKFHKDSTATVSVGDSLYAGQTLTNTLKFFEFNSGVVPTTSELSALHLGPEFLGQDYAEGIVFENKTSAVTVDTSGLFTEMRFDVGGWPIDVAEFWDAFHSRGVAAGTTLAQLLDTRTNPTGEPVASNLPATINPMGFLIANVLRNNAFAARVRFNYVGENALDLGNLRILRNIIPPNTTMLLIVELEAGTDTCTINEEGTTTVTGSSETTEVFDGTDEVTEAFVATTYAADAVSSHYIQGVCV